MAKSVVGLNIKIGATVASLQADLNKASGAVRQFGATAGGAAGGVTRLSAANAALSSGVGKVVGFLKTQVGAMIAVAASMAAATVSIRAFAGAFTDIEDVANLADKIGATTESIVGLRKAATLGGSSASAMDDALVKMTKTVGLAIAGNKAAAESFTGIGISIAQLKAASPGEQIRLVAEAINKLGTQSEKTAAATKIFGRSASDLVNVLAGGRKGLDEIQKEVDDLGESFSRIEAQKVLEANDAIDRMKAALKGVTTELAIALAPAVVKVAEAITKAIQVARQFNEQLQAFSKFGGFGLTGIFIAWANDAVEAESATKRFADRVKEAIALQEAAKDKDSMWAGWIPGTEETRDFTTSFEDTLTEVAAMVRERWIAIGESITDSVKTPFEKMQEKIAEVKNAFAGGFIDEETATRAITAARDELDKLTAAKDSFRSSPSVGAAVAGTTGGFAAVQDGQKALRDLATSARKREVSEKKREKLLDDIAKDLEEIKKKTIPIKVKEEAII